MTESPNNPSADGPAGDRLAEEVARLGLPIPADDGEAMLLKAGRILPVVGLVLLVVTWYQVSGTEYVADQIPMLVSGGLLALALMIIGLGLFIRYSISRTLRFWNARQLVEQQAQTDRIVEAITRLEIAVRDERDSSSRG